MEEDIILHPRPSAIVAALYTLRDLDVDVAIIHGPSGCCFRHSRMLEEDGMTVLTTAMDERNFVFGAHDALVQVLRAAEKMFKPSLMGVVGTCSSMIIGEDIHEAVIDSGVSCSVIEVEVHAGYRDNTTGVIKTLEAAVRAGVIDNEEFRRQKRILEAATEIEKRVGAASKKYIPISKGDSKISVAERLIELIERGKKGICVLNAKKETAFMFADILRAVNIAAAEKGGNLVNIANLASDVGLKRVRGYAERILNDLAAHGIEIAHITGGLDEYPISGERASRIIRENYADRDFAVLIGVPHAVTPLPDEMEIFSVTNGPRTVEPLRSLGHHHVVLELDLHPKTMGVKKMIPSEFGDAIMKALRDGKTSQRS
ncbi:MAG: Ni-sirohydrochlorin a,c-diamide reductive cyclase catalytic subunit [Canidatus Methanoxibalbensis ujae]|nr:Ni-sirohydrochlorin a,c-diamide reductive cyclase catalytic subunit [Candidatus Methanoxibalbensis ujae]